jgi:hypothetical protein
MLKKKKDIHQRKGKTTLTSARPNLFNFPKSDESNPTLAGPRLPGFGRTATRQLLEAGRVWAVCSLAAQAQWLMAWT